MNPEQEELDAVISADSVADTLVAVRDVLAKKGTDRTLWFVFVSYAYDKMGKTPSIATKTYIDILMGILLKAPAVTKLESLTQVAFIQEKAIEAGVSMRDYLEEHCGIFDDIKVATKEKKDAIADLRSAIIEGLVKLAVDTRPWHTTILYKYTGVPHTVKALEIRKSLESFFKKYPIADDHDPGPALDQFIITLKYDPEPEPLEEEPDDGIFKIKIPKAAQKPAHVDFDGEADVEEEREQQKPRQKKKSEPRVNFEEGRPKSQEKAVPKEFPSWEQYRDEHFGKAERSDFNTAKKRAEAYWKKHPRGKARDMAQLSSHIAKDASHFNPSRADWPGIDTP